MTIARASEVGGFVNVVGRVISAKPDVIVRKDGRIIYLFLQVSNILSLLVLLDKVIVLVEQMVEILFSLVVLVDYVGVMVETAMMVMDLKVVVEGL